MASQSNLDRARLSNRVVAGKRPDKAPGIGAIEFGNPAGDLAGTQADPFVVAVHLSDGTRLAIDGVNDGDVLARVGAFLTGKALAAVATSGAYGDLSGTPTLGTAAGESGLSVTIATAKLTALGADGSMTFTNGVLTAQTAAT